MSLHPTALSENVDARILSWLSEQTLPGAPRLQHAEEGRRGAENTPWLRVTPDEISPVYSGSFSSTLSAYRMARLYTFDLFFPESETGRVVDLYLPDRCASALRDLLTLRTWSFLDYLDPTSPTTVSGVRLRIHRPVQTRRSPPEAGLTRRTLAAVVEWVGRFDNAFAA